MTLWDWTYSQLHYKQVPACKNCKKKVKFGYLCLLKRDEEDKSIYCEHCGVEQ
jgi:DNA-directed RNA polymerase subunit RPC12/RpoP